MNRERDLAFFTVGFGQVTQLVPIFFALPKFLSGAIQLGGLMQIRIAFQQVASAIGWFIYAYRDIAEWSATVDRLAGFEAALSAPLPGSCVRQSERVAARGLVRSKTGEPLLEDLCLGAEPGRLTVVRGASGIGKTTLLRALAGFWPWVEGRLENRPGAVWLTQRTWLAPMPLRELLAYPHGADAVSRSGCEAALCDAGLERLVPLLDDDEPRSWMNTLSGGEQQRVLFARLLLARPAAVLMDETTSGLDDALAVRLLTLLRERLPDTTFLLVSHQPAVHRIADRLYDLGERA